jgi:hypothetical protein
MYVTFFSVVLDASEGLDASAQLKVSMPENHFSFGHFLELGEKYVLQQRGHQITVVALLRISSFTLIY